MKKILFDIKYLAMAISIIGIVSVSSCSKWLDTQPSNQTSADKLFKTEVGFQEALSGVYTLMTKENSYGREMTFGFVDVIAQQWALDKISSNSPYFGAKDYLFETELTRSLTEKIWLAQYNAIANVNDIIAFVDDRKNVFNEESGYAIVKGEALALRAFLHFDLLRLFAPNDFALGKETKYIPYVSEFSKNLSASLSAKEVVTKCIIDLEQAIELLKVDPIFTGIVLNDTYYKNRVVHLNYYAAKALLARIYFYTGDEDKALIVAKEVIAAQNANRFRWVSEIEATSSSKESRDYTFSSEHIFTLNIQKLEDYTKGYLVTPYDQVELKCRKYKSAGVSNLYENQEEYRFFLHDGYDFIKFIQLSTSRNKAKMPLIRISEMYYIAAECSKNSTEALAYLNMVRKNRRITGEVTDYTLLQSELFKEYQKEFVGEGQLFYYYKRLNMRIEASSDAYTFTLPLPRIEIDLGGRPRPNSN